MRPALRFEGVGKRYLRGGPGYASLRTEIIDGIAKLVRRGTQPRGTIALEDVSFEVAQGESFALIGANGAGKTTALKLVARISYPTMGRIMINGRVGALLEVGSGIHPELTARENILLYGQIMGMGREEIRRRFDEIVEFGELGHVLDRPVKMYSSGMQLRLGFSIASHLDPDIFVVDEALAVGDAGFQTKCIDRMTSLVREGRTLVFVSHTLPIVREVCDRGILLDQGRVLFEGTANDVVDRYLDHIAGSIASRHGRDEVIDIVGVRSLSERTGDSRIATNDPVRIEIDLEVKKDCPDSQLHLAIKDGRPTSLVSITMLSKAQTLDLSKGRHRWVIRTGPLPLLPGSYETLMAVSSVTKAINFMEPRIFGVLTISDGPEGRRRDHLFARDPGFGPVHVEWEMEVDRL